MLVVAMQTNSQHANDCSLLEFNNVVSNELCMFVHTSLELAA